MALKPIKQIKGRAVYLPGDAIDTDRIIPARFMKCVTFDGLGEFLFYDVRKNDDGSDREHPLNESRFKGATLLLSGSNFGCGSSREHAPQALYRYGFRGIIAESYAEIFFGNCTTLGIPCLCMEKPAIQALAAAIDRDPNLEITLDVESAEVRYLNQVSPATIRDSARTVLINGRWDPIGDLLEGLDQVHAVASKLSYMAP
jgi:3-isopropylmalate/(R)-2-methylmalate dehydratase small subunit